jgi:hypothetical protein
MEVGIAIVGLGLASQPQFPIDAHRALIDEILHHGRRCAGVERLVDEVLRAAKRGSAG